MMSDESIQPKESATQRLPVRVFLVEDSPAILKTLSKSLSRHEERVELVGEAMDGESAVPAIIESTAELVLLDLELPGIDGIEVTRRLKAARNDIDVLILTSFDDERKVYEAIQAGASGYLVKRVSISRILDAIDEVREGGVVLEPIIARRFWTYFDSVRRCRSSEEPAGNASTAQQLPQADAAGNSTNSTPPVPDWKLSDIEREVLLYIGKGLSNAEVGRVLKIDHRRVKTHLSRIYGKMGVNTHVEAIVKAIQAGIIEL